MKSKYQFEIMDLEDGLVAVPVGSNGQQFHGILKVNETATSILKLLEHDTSEEAITNSLIKEYTGDHEEIAMYVHAFLEMLITEGILA